MPAYVSIQFQNAGNYQKQFVDNHVIIQNQRQRINIKTISLIFLSRKQNLQTSRVTGIGQM